MLIHPSQLHPLIILHHTYLIRQSTKDTQQINLEQRILQIYSHFDQMMQIPIRIGLNLKALKELTNILQNKTQQIDLNQSPESQQRSNHKDPVVLMMQLNKIPYGTLIIKHLANAHQEHPRIFSMRRTSSIQTMALMPQARTQLRLSDALRRSLGSGGRLRKRKKWKRRRLQRMSTTKRI